MPVDLGAPKLSRRTFTGSLAGAVALSPIHSRRFTSAQSPSGSIRVGFEQGHVSEPFIDQTANSLREAYPGIDIELEPFAAGDYSTQIVLQLSMGRAPDVFMLSGVAIAELATSGLVAPLDRWLSGWDGWQYFPETIRAAIAYEESIWGLPYPIDTHFLYYRRDLFAQAGLPTDWQPTHPDDILAAARAVRDATPNVIPYALYAGANGGNSTVVRGFIPLVSAHGGTLTDD
ncbi:MAG: extracellular solute-binding protein, partial [Thermomicrobiales bacterium]